jgi:hypothetical protein
MGLMFISWQTAFCGKGEHKALFSNTLLFHRNLHSGAHRMFEAEIATSFPSQKQLKPPRGTAPLLLSHMVNAMSVRPSHLPKSPRENRHAD